MVGFGDGDVDGVEEVEEDELVAELGGLIEELWGYGEG